MMMTHLYIAGFLFMALALVHVIFPTYFNWDRELKPLSLINRQLMTIHTFFIALTVFLMGLLCVSSASDLLFTTLGKRIALGLGIFWSIRLFIQFFGYSSKLWKGKKLETSIHILATFLWTYFSVLFFTIYYL